MDCLIIGAMTEETPIENYYRHQLLKKFLEKWCPAETIEVVGSDGTFHEQSIMVMVNGLTSEQKWDFINFARMFEQKYIVLVENDKVYEINCNNGDPRYLGVWWDIDDMSCPDTVKESMASGPYTQVFSTGQTWGIQTPAMAKEWARRLRDDRKAPASDVPSFFGGKLEHDAHLARTYPYK